MVTTMITLKQLTLEEAEERFPGCITDDILELDNSNKDGARLRDAVAVGGLPKSLEV